MNLENVKKSNTVQLTPSSTSIMSGLNETNYIYAQDSQTTTRAQPATFKESEEGTESKDVLTNVDVLDLKNDPMKQVTYKQVIIVPQTHFTDDDRNKEM